MPRPVILSTAWEDIDGIAESHLRTVGPRSAEAITDAILDAIDLLESMPYLGPLHQDPTLQRLGFRKLLVKKYVCVYRLVDGVPTVYDVFHQTWDYPAEVVTRN